MLRDTRGIPHAVSYKHSDGRTLLFTTAMAGRANVYDLAKVIAGGDPTQWKVGEVPVPDTRENTPLGRQGYHDFYVAYDAATHQDTFYGAGRGGYYVYDVSNVTEPKLLTSITGTAGVAWGHTITPDPTGRFAVTETEYTYAPLRMFDLKPGRDGKVQRSPSPLARGTRIGTIWRTITKCVGRSSSCPPIEDGLQFLSMYDPTHPVTVGWYYTCHCTHNDGIGRRAADVARAR